MNKSLILALTALVPLAAADEVKLKDGTVYKDCTVEVETPESVSLLVPVAGGIKDSVTVKRELIESIKKATPDELEAAKINKTYAKPETMNAKDLESALADLDKTIKKNPQGLAHDAAVKARARVVVLLEEKKLVEGAQAAQEAKEEAEVTVRTKYDHEANKLLKRFKALAVRNPYQAMAVYDRLRDGYPGSAALADAYPDASRIAGQLNRKLEVMIAAKEKALEKERETLRKEEEKRRGDPKLTKEQRQLLMDAFQKRQTAIRERENQLTEVHRALRKKVKERGDRWFEPAAGSLEAMRDVKLVAATDAERLKNQDPENGAGSAALEKAWNLCDEKKFDEAMEALTEGRTAQRPREYYEELTETVRAGLQEQRARERAERAEAARKAREDRDKKRQEERAAAAKARKK